MPDWYYDSVAKRYGYEDSRSGDTVQLVYQGDSIPTSVRADQLTPAGSVISWFQTDGSGDFSELLWNAVARAGLAVGYEGKSVTGMPVKEFIAADVVYELFAKSYLDWIQLVANAPVTVNSPPDWFNTSDWQGSLNRTLQVEIIRQAYNLVVRKGLKFSLSEMAKTFVSYIASNIVSRRSAGAGTSFRAE